MKILLNNIYILLLLSSLVVLSCDDDTTGGVSRITTYPDFTISGEEKVVIKVGTGFTDQGVIAEEGGEEIPVTKTVIGSSYIVPGQTQPEEVQYRTLSEVDDETPGIYWITYSAVNSDGFPGSVERIVFVLDDDPDPDVDLSGDYASGSSPEATITKITDGVFYSTNVWGGGSTVKIGAYVLTADGVNINIPQQESLVRIFGYGTRDVSGVLDLKMSRPTFANPAPLIDLTKVWEPK